MPLPSQEGFYMPAEWAPHSRCWMAWPSRQDVWGDRLDAARDAFSAMAKAIAEFEPVTMIANPEDLAEVSLRFASGVSCIPMAHDDSWMRDIGPTFIIDGKGGIAGLDWRFNAWGEKHENYEKDAAVAAAVLEHAKIARIPGPMVVEGGAFHVDGEGTVLATEQTLLNPNRNQNLWPEEIERILRGHLGAEKLIWLGEGLTDDQTDGHVDNLACFVRPGVVLALSCSDPEDSNYAALQDNLKRLRAATDAKGRALEVIEIEQPRARTDAKGRRMALSYVNFYIANGGVILPSFEDPADKLAYETVSQCFPHHEIVQLSALEIVSGSGGMHCITQQQPVAES